MSVRWGHIRTAYRAFCRAEAAGVVPTGGELAAVFRAETRHINGGHTIDIHNAVERARLESWLDANT